MCDSGVESKPTRLWRNGLEYVPPKKYPPDYSNVPSVRDWQMSPFGNERYDLDEQQRLEKKGVKGQMQLAYLKKKEEEMKQNPCEKCRERERQTVPGPVYLPPQAQTCAPRYLYQPYGPPPVPIPSFAQQQSERNPLPKVYPSPNLQPPRCLTCSTPEKLPPVEYPENFIMNRCENAVAGYGYVPYGPTSELKINPDFYKPYGRQETNYQKLVDPPAEDYGTILGDPNPPEGKGEDKKSECVQIVLCSSAAPCVNDGEECEKKSS